MREAMVAFVPKAMLSGTQLVPGARTWGEVQSLCPGVRFATEPVGSYCTGVLVDDDVILSAGHCVGAYPLADAAIVFGWYFQDEGVLAPFDVYGVAGVVAEEHEAQDYAFIRLDRQVTAPRAPSPVRFETIAVDAKLVSLSAGGGVPMKVDLGGRVVAHREGYFVATTDTFAGSSGGGVFDESGALVGVLARGAEDFTKTEDGCSVPAVSTGEGEQYTYAAQAITAWCAGGATSALCDQQLRHGCNAAAPSSWWVLAVLAGLRLRRREALRARVTRGVPSVSA